MSFSGKTSFQPDLLFISRERLDVIQKGRIYGAPDLTVEILSSGTASRSRNWKRNLYARHGVREYWIVDPFSKTVEVLELTGGEYRVHSKTADRGKLTSSVLHGLDLSLSMVFGYGD